MAKRVVVKIGDVFEAMLDGGKKGYVQYIGNDVRQLNSDVVRVFKKRYGQREEPNIEDVVSDDVEFYSHVVGVEFGVKDGTWKKRQC